MREILFRGKTLIKGEPGTDGGWVYGAFCPKRNDMPFSPMVDNPSIIKLDKPCDGYWYDVWPETVGQYTGLQDKNGKRIFEGDIVHILGNQSVEDWKYVDYTALIAFLDGGFCAIDGTIEDHGFRRYALARMDFDMEIIGNIYDNPELLEGGAEV